MPSPTGRSLLWLLSTLLLILGGCVGNPPPREDPFSGLSFSNIQKEDPLGGHSFGDIQEEGLVLAMVISQNSKNSVEWIHEARATGVQWGSDSIGDDLDARPLIDNLTNVLGQSFSTIVRVNSPVEAASAGADLIAVVDLYVQLGQVSLDTTEVDLTVLFTRLDGHPIKTVTGVGQAKVPWPAWHHGLNQGDLTLTLFSFGCSAPYAAYLL